MNLRLTILPVIAAALCFLGNAGASERWETLKAINLVENPTNQTHVGLRGELGPYQFRVSTWRMHTQKPFNMAIDRATADEVAVSHYEWLKRELRESGVEPSTFNIAMAWNCGLAAVVSGRIPTESYHYAERVATLAEAIERQVRTEAVAAAKPAPVPVQSEFAVQFASADTGAPHYVLVTDSSAPRLMLAGEPARFVLAPGALAFTVASLN